METNQIYALINSINSQTMGENAIEVTDTASLIALGKTVLDSGNNVDAFTNALVQRIGKTVFSYKKYENKFKGLLVDDFTFGAIVQKIKVNMPTAEESPIYDLDDGTTIDMYEISKPTVKQKLFVKRTPYLFKITIQEKSLKEAFLNETAMGSFITLVYGEVQNKIELTMENLGRLAVANYMALTGAGQRIHLLTDYNTLAGTTLTATTCLIDNGFLRYAIGQLNLYSKRMTDMSVKYNTEGEKRHTPFKDQYYITTSDFETAMQTQVQYAAFHDKYVSKATDVEVNYWQAEDSPFDISLKVDVDGTPTDRTLSNVVGVIFDKSALGMYKKDEAVRTTPENAKGLYTNTFWHAEQLWFNDHSENGIVFMLD